MANFLDKKEEVIKVELTKHGKKRLGMGIFNPSYCSFFDYDVIYDNSYTGLTNENVNSIQDRIIYESPSVSSLSTLEDVLDAPLGTSDIFNDYAPAWDLSLLNGTMQYSSSVSSFYKKIFNFNDIQAFKSLDTKSESLNNRNVISFELEDGSYINIQNDYILIEINEQNVSGDTKNFDIELITFDDIFGGKEAGLERKLNFITRKNNIIDGLIYDETELPFIALEQNITADDVAYYFDLLVDDEIDATLIKAKETTVQEQFKGTYDSNFTGPAKEDC